MDTLARRSRASNRLLATLPRDEYERLRPNLQTVRLTARDALVQPQTRITQVYFPRGAVCSIGTTTTDGRAAAVALVGSEGAIGVPRFFNDLESQRSVTVEIANGDAAAMDINVFRRELELGGAFSEVVRRYWMAFTESLMQSVACNALHSIEQRYARCLLEIRDRIGCNEFPLTQDAVALARRAPRIDYHDGRRSASISHHRSRPQTHRRPRSETA
jgi:hypothetical protein